jgi:hypothetical protein
MLVDYGRILFINKQLHNMISPYRQFTNKYLPTLNFFDANTAYSWLRMKKQTFIYGNQFIERNNLTLASLAFQSIVVYGVTWLNNLGYVKLGKNLSTDISIFFDIDYFLYTIVQVGVLVFIAKINQFDLEIHTQLHLVKDFLFELQFYTKHFLNLGKPKSSLVKFETSVVFDTPLASAVVKAHI